MVDKNIFIREIQKTDMSFVIELLQSISKYKPSKSEYTKIWNKFKNQKNIYALVAITNNKIVGYGSIVIETKIRGGKMGHIEDIVSHKDFRKSGVGRAIVDKLFVFAKKKGCYKVALQCKKQNILFYKKCNYKVNAITMQRLA
jgi:glucosamine-phosphate N-acetyltransferase